ncbi:MULTISPECIES: RICIN domain-containing protein [Streptomycetaceae]|uniref:Hydrolytic protein n=1 Tax=Streptantibioticus cattleyicolor (strain ATCC 35852 / DSM 46488 / JCM 4925 / NBRC 14057 / NRRL 8057) TaxID=1003195 RepID=F8JQR4_STREN|nr:MULTISPECIES: RICIN domain-containing protein [Streptomycetaceae]AEW92794.1 hydrolytic protein [Streptantibioticus cattleyicolor NRRL 8057 = DSM 46488]MYS57555.1 hypothetical protein [Streptomyces sp. SID5468]CCB73149.1 protein of unknown function [Streptantibioticus cattleyicolor NRRL 8057 = DSM 46488]
MSAQRETDGNDRNSGVRRAVALPAANTEAFSGLTPGRDAGGRPEAGQAGAPVSAADAPVPAAGAPVPAAKTTSSVPAVAPASGGGNGGGGAPAVWAAEQPATGDDGEAGEASPGRPKRVVMAAAVGGVALLAIPFLLVGTGSSKEKTHPTADVGNAALGGSAQQPQALVSVSPLPSTSSSGSPSPSASASSGAPSSPAADSPSTAPSTAKPPATEKRDDQSADQQRSAPFPVVFAGAGHVLLKNAGTGLCADIPGFGSGSVNGPVNQYYCQPGDGDNQMWALQVVDAGHGPGGEKLFTIRNTKDSLCMDLPNYGANPAGTAVSEYPCAPTTGDNQLWYLASGDGGSYQIRNLAAHGLCLSVRGGAGAGHDARLIIDPCDSSADDWTWPSG